MGNTRLYVQEAACLQNCLYNISEIPACPQVAAGILEAPLHADPVIEVYYQREVS